MVYRRLGNSGLQVSALSFGAWVTFGKQIGDGTARKLLHRAYEAGINFFDNAEAYADGQAEVVMGRILREAGWRRGSYLVSSKVFFGAEGDRPNEAGLSRKHVVEACHAALRRLQVDYLDLYFCHRPDPAVPVEETARAMHDLIVRGKVLYWGTSEWSARELTAAHAICRRLGLHAPVMEQPQYNLFHRNRVEREYAPLYRRFGLGTTICRRWPRVFLPASTARACPRIPGSASAAWNGCARTSSPATSAPAWPPWRNWPRSPPASTLPCPSSRWLGA